MNKEKMNQIIELAWKKYADSHFTPGNPNGKLLSEQLASVRPMMHNRETFREEIIKNPSFASQWGLKIEERELSEKERMNTLIQNEQRLIYEEVQSFKNVRKKKIKDCLDERNAPTKLITITYNDIKTEIYE